MARVDSTGDISGDSNPKVNGRIVATGYVWQKSGALDRLKSFGQGAHSRGFALSRQKSSSGEIFAVGQAEDAGSSYLAALWKMPVTSNKTSFRAVAPKNLGHLPGEPQAEAHAVNNAGWIVGDSSSLDYMHVSAFLWRAGHMYDLNKLIPAGSGWQLGSALGVNNAGRIVRMGDLRRPRARLSPNSALGRIGTLKTHQR
jgi:probable HAF family extracellular repeat protein